MYTVQDDRPVGCGDLHAGPPEGEADPVLAGEPQVVGGLRLEVLQDIANLVLASTQQTTIRQKTNSQR